MRFLSLLFCFFIASAASFAAAQQPSGGTPAPRYTIDLQTAPEKRWANVIADQMPGIMLVKQWINTILPDDIEALLDPFLAKIDDYLDPVYAAEMRGVAASSQGVLRLGEVVFLNLIYDITAGCTSVVSQDDDGHMIHVRHLDYDIPHLQNVTVIVDWTNGTSEVLYSTTNFATYVGVLSGMRHSTNTSKVTSVGGGVIDGWSITVNERDRDAEDHYTNHSVIDNIIEGIARGGQPIGLTLRKWLEQTPYFVDAVQLAESTRFMAAVYLTLAGANAGEASVITRAREAVVDVLPVSYPSQWGVFVTNFDRDKPDGDGRRAPLTAAMSKLSPGAGNINAQNLLNVLQLPPIFNKSTRYTLLAQPDTNTYQTWIRFDAPQSVDVALTPFHQRLGLKPGV